MVGHGGSGSTLAALAAGVPVAFIPLFVDGHDNARRVAAAGAGRLVDGDLATVIARLNANAAQEIADEIAALPPVSVGQGKCRADTRLVFDAARPDGSGEECALFDEGADGSGAGCHGGDLGGVGVTAKTSHPRSLFRPVPRGAARLGDPLGHLAVGLVDHLALEHGGAGTGACASQ